MAELPHPARSPTRIRTPCRPHMNRRGRLGGRGRERGRLSPPVGSAPGGWMSSAMAPPFRLVGTTRPRPRYDASAREQAIQSRPPRPVGGRSSDELEPCRKLRQAWCEALPPASDVRAHVVGRAKEANRARHIVQIPPEPIEPDHTEVDLVARRPLIVISTRIVGGGQKGDVALGRSK